MVDKVVSAMLFQRRAQDILGPRSETFSTQMLCSSTEQSCRQAKLDSTWLLSSTPTLTTTLHQEGARQEEIMGGCDNYKDNMLFQRTYPFASNHQHIHEHRLGDQQHMRDIPG